MADPPSYTIRKIDSTTEGHLYVEVEFADGLINDFVFVGLRTERYGPAVDEHGRWLTHDADQHPVLRQIDVPRDVTRAIEAFLAEVPEKGHAGDMRNPKIKLGGPDPHGVRAAFEASCS